MYFRKIALAFSTEIFEGCAVAQPSWLWGQRGILPVACCRPANPRGLAVVGQPFLVAAHRKGQAEAPALQSGLRFNQRGLAASVSPGVAAHRLLFR